MLTLRTLMTALLGAAGILAASELATAQTKWNLPPAYAIDNPHTVNLNAFAKDVADATGGKLQITGWRKSNSEVAAFTFTDASNSYAERTGSDVGEILWYQVFAAFKLAVIIQQIYIRYVRGQTRDSRFATYATRVLGLARKAQALIG